MSNESKITMQVVVNSCYGGFSLSKKAILRMRELNSEWAHRVLFEGDKHPWQNFVQDRVIGDCYSFAASNDNFWEEVDRTDPILIQVVEELGPEAGGQCAALEVQEIQISIELISYDGHEKVSVSSYVL